MLAASNTKQDEDEWAEPERFTAAHTPKCSYYSTEPLTPQLQSGTDNPFVNHQWVFQAFEEISQDIKIKKIYISATNASLCLSRGAVIASAHLHSSGLVKRFCECKVCRSSPHPSLGEGGGDFDLNQMLLTAGQRHIFVVRSFLPMLL